MQSTGSTHNNSICTKRRQGSPWHGRMWTARRSPRQTWKRKNGDSCRGTSSPIFTAPPRPWDFGAKRERTDSGASNTCLPISAPSVSPPSGDSVNLTSAESVARKARYVGSAEHKGYPSAAGPPALRSDATPCDPGISSADIGSALAEGIRRGCVSALTEQGFPKYVWGWLGDDLYEARHINGPAGTYKGYRIEESERPLDRYGRLNREDSA